MLAALVVWPLLIGTYWFVACRRRRHATIERGFESQGRTGRWRRLPHVLFALAVGVLLFSTSRPQITLDLPRQQGTVILAFDTSNSMRADDVAPTRLDAAKELAVAFVDDRPGSVQIGIVTFGSGGLLIVAPTDDETALLDAIDRVVPDGSTSLGRGLFAALDAIDEAPFLGDLDDPVASPDLADLADLDIGYFGSAVIVLLSDGEDTTELDPLDVATLASNAGVRVFSVGVGDPAGTTIEVDGFTLATALDPAQLTAIADLTDGAYIEGPGVSTGADLTDLFDAVDTELTVEGEETEITGLLAALGALLLVAGAAVSMAWFGRAP